MDRQLGQIAITAVLLAMIGGALLIRFNGAIASWLTALPRPPRDAAAAVNEMSEQKVVVAGYGRVGHAVAVLLQASGIPFVAFDTDAQRVAYGRSQGHPVSYGDISEPALLEAIQVGRARMVLVTVDHAQAAHRTVAYLRRHCPQVPVIARGRDLDLVPGRDEVRIEHHAVVTDAFRVESLETLRALGGHHALTERTIESRFRYRDRPYLHALLLRVYRIPRPHLIPNTLGYEGCVSWVELDDELETSGAAPVLEDGRFAELRRSLLDLLEGRDGVLPV